MKRLLSLVLGICLVFVLAFTGCNKQDNNNNNNQQNINSNKDNENKNSENKGNNTSDAGGEESTDDSSIVNPAGEFPIVDETVTLKVVFPDDSLIEDIETNKLTTFMEDLTNVHVEWQLIPSADISQKVNLMLATNTDLPDVFLGCSNPISGIASKYGEEGILISLNDYIDSYGSELKKIFSINENYKKQILSPDGKIYSLPSINEGKHMLYVQRMWVYQPWLDKLDIEIPKTTQDFYDMLVAFKEEDPNGNGIADEIPFVGANAGGWLTNVEGYLMCPFIYNDSGDRIVIEDGRLDVVYNKPEWKEGLKYINKLCEEGLLDPVSITQKKEQLIQLCENQDIPIVGSVVAGSNTQFVNSNGDRVMDYTIIPPLTGPDGVCTAAYNPPIAKPGELAITSECDYPEVAYRWADYMFTEDFFMRTRYGEPNVDWVEPDEGTIGVNGQPAKIKAILQWGSIQNSGWVLRGPTFRTDEMTNGMQLTETDKGSILNMKKYKASLKYAQTVNDGQPEEYLQTLSMTADESVVYNELKTTLNDYVKEVISLSILGDLDIEKDWDTYLKTLKDMGLDQYLELLQKVYDRQYK